MRIIENKPEPESDEPIEAESSPQTPSSKPPTEWEEIVDRFRWDLRNRLAGFPTDSYTALLDKIRQEDVPESHLSRKVLNLLHDAIVEFCWEDFSQLTQANRSARRDYFKNLATERSKYLESIKTGVTAEQQFLRAKISSVVEECGIGLRNYQQSLGYWTEIDPKFGMIVKSLVNKLKLMVGQPHRPENGDYNLYPLPKANNSHLTEILENLKMEASNPETRMKFEDQGWENLANQV
jgi:hypothetical protein